MEELKKDEKGRFKFTAEEVARADEIAKDLGTTRAKILENWVRANLGLPTVHLPTVWPD